jgi:hypothetical protein
MGVTTTARETLTSFSQLTKDRLAAFPLALDLLFYFACFSYAAIVAASNEFYGFRIWGNFAMAGYGLAALCTLWLAIKNRTLNDGEEKNSSKTGGKDHRVRWISLGIVGGLGILAPLVFLIIKRLGSGDWLTSPSAWTAQPEVWVIERSARLLLEHGTPYVDVTTLGRPAVVNDYTPYGPVMAIFGLPKALLGGTPVTDALTDSRVMFLLTFLLCTIVILKLVRPASIPIRSAQFVTIFPLTALTCAVAGPDLAMLGLLLLAVALAARDHPVASGVVVGLVGSAKLLPLLAAPVLIALVFSRQGKRGGLAFVSSMTATCVVANVPVFLVNPQAFLEHVFRFPAGIGVVPSPAASPLPGYLIASTGSVGKTLAFGLLAVAGVAILLWLIRKPPLQGSQALIRISVGLLAFTLLTTATRYGYLIYPLITLSAVAYFRRAERTEPQTTAPATLVSHR